MQEGSDRPAPRKPPGGHSGFDWPVGGGDPFDRRQPWPSRLYWAHERPSRLFTADTTPSEQDLMENIRMGYTTLTLMERVALVTPGARGGRVMQHTEQSPRTAPLQPYQLILRPAEAGGGYLRLGASWPFRWAQRDAADLSARTGEVVLVCRVLEYQNWH